MRKAMGAVGVACVLGAATWMLRAPDVAPLVPGAAHAVAAQARVVLPTGVSFESPQPLRLDAALARAAVRDGTLRIAMPDGREHAIAIERQYTDESGHWNVVGRAPTRIGAQAMVLTFGANAVFGRIPMPDGSALHVVTTPGDRVVVTPDGGVVPRNAARVIGQTDVVMPDRSRMPATQAMPTSMPPATMASASGRTRLPSTIPARTASATVAQPLMPAALDTTPVTINVITIYTPGQVTLRGTVSAVETEIANLVAISNQAHIDSGSRVRLASVHVRKLAIPPTDLNTTVLSSVAFSPKTDGVDLQALRDQYSGDLVSVLRPHDPNDWTCGVAYTPGFAYERTRVDAMYGFSVVNVDGDCGTLVHAHELGHNLGSMHDRDTDTDSAGITLHGAYVFSSGYSTNAFATVMAYRDGSLEQQWIGRFSNPAKRDCVGAPCGIAGYSDNVRSLNLMAPAIAAFRGAPNKLSIADIEVLAPHYEQLTVTVPIRLSGVAGVDGVRVNVSVVGGTATENEDYLMAVGMVTIGPGQREGYAQLLVNPDVVAEGDETIALSLHSPDAQLADGEAVITLSESDPRVTMSGRVWFPGGAAPTNAFLLEFEGLDGFNTRTSQELVPPDFAYSVQVPSGMQVAMTAHHLPDPFVLPTRKWNEVRIARTEQLLAEPGVLITATLGTSSDMTLTDPAWISRSQWDGTQPTYDSLEMHVGGEYAMRVPRGGNLGFEWYGPYDVAGNAKPFAPYKVYWFDLRRDTRLDITLSSLPTLVAPPDLDVVTSGRIYLAVNLEGSAPEGGTSFRYRTIDGTAKAGQDYNAVSGTLTIPAGSSQGVYIPEIRITDDGMRGGPQYFDVVLDRVVGAQRPRAIARIHIHADPMRTGGPARKQ